jgi:malonyl-CoA/methylmalonyl-CoA synthetase
MLTQANLAANAVALAHAWRFSRQDQLLHALPLFHVHGLCVAINTVLVAGAGLMLLPKFDAATVLQHLAQASVFMGVPTHYTRLLQEPGLDRHAAARVRLFVSGSAPLLPQTLERFRARTGQTILERYGMTETLRHVQPGDAGARIPGSVGLPLESVAVRVTERGGGTP